MPIFCLLTIFLVIFSSDTVNRPPLDRRKGCANICLEKKTWSFSTRKKGYLGETDSCENSEIRVSEIRLEFSLGAFEVDGKPASNCWLPSWLQMLAVALGAALLRRLRLRFGSTSSSATRCRARRRRKATIIRLQIRALQDDRCIPKSEDENIEEFNFGGLGLCCSNFANFAASCSADFLRML